MKKKLLAMLLAAVMLMAMLPTAFAADPSGKCGDNLTWTYSNGTLTIQGTGPIEDYTWVIEDNGSKQPWYDYKDEIRTVTISEGVTAIGAFAFGEHHSLTSVTIPGSVTSIGEWAFGNCVGLTNVTISDGVTTIGKGAFSSCSNLTSVTIPGSVTTIGDNAFEFCYRMTSATILNGVTTIGEEAFYSCYSLTSITIPGSITTIGEHAFDVCENLTDVYYGGNASQWKQIFNDDDYTYPLTNVHYNSAPAEPTEPTEPTTPTFTDVNEGDWYYKEVQWAAGQNITNGTGDGTTFSPRSNCTHAQILTMLWRAAGEIEAAPSPFIVADAYQGAVDWAYEQGMLGSPFIPSDPCTRADAVKYIWEVFGKQSGADISFEDVDADAYYAAAVAWAVGAGVVDGTDDTHFTPDMACNRGTIATLLYRAYVEPLPR